MMHPGEAQVVVRRLRYRGPPALRGRVLDTLDSAPWPPLPATEYLFLRRLRIRGAWWAMAGLTQRTAAEQAARAVPGWHPDARGADAVRFASLAELLACLSIDLSRPRSGQAWYWALWQALFELPPGEALTRLWSEHVLELPALFAELEARQAWAAAMATVSAAGLERLLAAICTTTGWRAPHPPATPTPSPGEGRTASVAAEAPARLPVRASARRSAWLRLIRGAPPARRPPLRRLAMLTLAWEFEPQAVHRPQRLAVWSQALEPERAGSPPPMAGGATPHPASPPATPGRPAKGVAPASPGPGPRKAPRQTRGGGGTVPGPTVPPGPAVPPLPPSRQAARGAPAPALSRTDDGAPPGTAATTDPGPARGTESFHTRQGGLFYLLNVLNRPWVLDLLRDEPAGGWRRLYRLGLALGLRMEPALGQFLAARLDLDHPARLGTVPPLPGEALLLTRLHHDWGRYGFWGPGLLSVAARIDHSPSHLDAHYPLESIDLEIRLAGLDQDPGWLPWLGRVVSFHYEAGPGPGRERVHAP